MDCLGITRVFYFADRRGGSRMLPQDPVILLSYVNTQLRDRYATLDELCEDLDTEKAGLTAKLAELGYVYDPEQNRFR